MRPAQDCVLWTASCTPWQAGNFNNETKDSYTTDTVTVNLLVIRTGKPFVPGTDTVIVNLLDMPTG